MKKFYKICICLLLGLFISGLNISNARLPFLQRDWQTRESVIVEEDDPSISGDNVSGGIAAGTAYETDKLKGILHFPERSEYSSNLGYALALIKISINRILGMLAFVALIYMLYCGFLVFSSGADDTNAKKGRKGISNAAIALAGIGLSWMIISVMIWFISIFSSSGK